MKNKRMDIVLYSMHITQDALYIAIKMFRLGNMILNVTKFLNISIVNLFISIYMFYKYQEKNEKS